MIAFFDYFTFNFIIGSVRDRLSLAKVIDFFFFLRKLFVKRRMEKKNVSELVFCSEKLIIVFSKLVLIRFDRLNRGIMIFLGVELTGCIFSLGNIRIKDYELFRDIHLVVLDLYLIIRNINLLGVFLRLVIILRLDLGHLDVVLVLEEMRIVVE